MPAPNLLSNGTFDSDAAGWSVQSANLAIATVADGSPEPQALELTLAPISLRSQTGAYQCVPVQPNRTYAFEAQYRIPADAPSGAGVTVFAALYAGASCSGSFVGEPRSGPFVAMRGAWTPYSFAIDTFGLPDGTTDARLLMRLDIVAPAGSSGTQTRWDSVSLTAHHGDFRRLRGRQRRNLRRRQSHGGRRLQSDLRARALRRREPLEQRSLRRRQHDVRCGRRLHAGVPHRQRVRPMLANFVQHGPGRLPEPDRNGRGRATQRHRAQHPLRRALRLRHDDCLRPCHAHHGGRGRCVPRKLLLRQRGRYLLRISRSGERQLCAPGGSRARVDEPEHPARAVRRG